MTEQPQSSGLFPIAGWLFADLLLILTLVFLGANSVGSGSGLPGPPPIDEIGQNQIATEDAVRDATATASAHGVEIAQADLTDARATQDALATAVAAVAAVEGTMASISTTASAERSSLAATEAAAARQAATLAAEQVATSEAKATESSQLATEVAEQQALAATEVAIRNQSATEASLQMQTEVARRTQADATGTAIANDLTLAATGQAASNAVATEYAEQLATAENALSAANRAATEQAIEHQKAATEQVVAMREATESAAFLEQASTAVAEANHLATESAQSVHLTYAEITIPAVMTDDASIFDTEPGRELLTEALMSARLPYQEAGCRVGMVVTFVHAARVGDGQARANTVNDILRENLPELVGDAIFENWGYEDLNHGQVDVRLYLFNECELADATATSDAVPPLATLPGGRNLTDTQIPVGQRLWVSGRR